MDDQRTLQRHSAPNGQTYVRTLGKSWKGAADDPVADTKYPIVVDDPTQDSPSHLRPHEAEQLIGGMPCPSGDPAGRDDSPGTNTVDL